MPFAARTERRIKAIATISALDLGSLMSEGLGRTQDPAVLNQMLDNAGAQRTTEATGNQPTYLPFTPESPEGLPDAPALYRQAYDYYRTPRAAHPRSVGHCLAPSIERITQFHAYAGVARLPDSGHRTQ